MGVRILALLALMAGATYAAEVQTARGPMDVAEAPKKVVVFDLAALDTLQALGVEVAGIPRPLYLPYLQAGDAAPVGTLFEPDMEALAALQPDLIIAGGRSAKVVPDLARLAPTVDMTISDALTDGQARLHDYGVLFGKEEVAAALQTTLQGKLETVRDAARGRALIVMTNGPKVSVFGKAGRFGWLYDLGFEQADPGLAEANHGEAVSFEYLHRMDPDVMIVLDRLAAIGQEGASAQETLDNPLVHGTKAWKSGQMIYLSAGPLYVATGGVQSLGITLDEMLAALSR